MQGRALADAFPIARETFAEADRALGEPLSRLCWEGPDEALMLTENTQPAVLTTSIAAYRVLESAGLAGGERAERGGGVIFKWGRRGRLGTV